jgi:hypothetical protein
MVLATCAAICRQVGLPFRYPGNRYTLEHFCDMTDARVLAKQHVWAAVTKKAKNQAFNCTNGDVFKWKSMWKVLCKTFAVKFVELDEKEEFDLCSLCVIRVRFGIRLWRSMDFIRPNWRKLLVLKPLLPVFRFEFQLVSSMNKSKNYEFFEYAETFNSVKFWVMKLREMNLIPIYEH